MAQQNASYAVEVLSSKIKILGETNVNKFECELFIPTVSNSQSVNSVRSELSISFDDLILTYRINAFGCGISAMTEDFKEILRADEFPNLLLQINQITISPDSEGFDRLDVSAAIKVTIAGVSKDLIVSESYIINESESILTLYGKQAVNMTDFSIDPPIRFWGALRVGNRLEIDFKIRMYNEAKKKENRSGLPSKQ